MAINNNILAEAIADAKRVKATAVAAAKSSLEETFQPRLTRMVSAQIHEEEGDEEFETDDLDINIDVNGPDDEMDMDDDSGAQDIGMGSFSDDDEEGSGDMELESLIRELEGEEEDPMMEGEEDEWQDPVPDNMMDEDYCEDDDMMEGMEDDDEMVENLLRELEGEDDETSEDDGLFENEDGAGAYEEAGPTKMMNTENRKLRNENKKLKSDLNQAIRALTTYKTTVNEVNLMNAKLMFTTKTFREFTLNENQQGRILDSFDRAKNVREVKLIYSTIVESFTKNRNRPIQEQKGSASKSTKVINPKKDRLDENASPEIVRWSSSRMQQLAGIKPINDGF